MGGSSSANRRDRDTALSLSSCVPGRRHVEAHRAGKFRRGNWLQARRAPDTVRAADVAFLGQPPPHPLPLGYAGWLPTLSSRCCRPAIARRRPGEDRRLAGGGIAARLGDRSTASSGTGVSRRRERVAARRHWGARRGGCAAGVCVSARGDSAPIAEGVRSIVHALLRASRYRSHIGHTRGGMARKKVQQGQRQFTA